MSNTRQLKRRKRWLKLLLFAIFLIIVFFLPSYLIKKNPTPAKTTQTITGGEIERYYVPIAHFTDADNDVSLNKIKEYYTLTDKEVYVGKDQKETVKKLLGLKELKANVINDSEVVGLVAKKANRFALVPFYQTTPNVKTLSVNNLLLWDKPSSYSLKIKARAAKEEPQFETAKVTLLTNVGDVILGRHVASKMKEYNDYTHPWLKMASLLAKADLTFADLECPLSDQLTPPDDGMSFITPQKTIAGFKLAGIDVVGLANNHSTNFGDAFTDTLDLLTKNNIKYVGGGRNSTEAYAPVYIEKNGIKFAFVDFNSIIGAINATSDSPGVAKFDIKPWAATDNQNDIDRIKAIIKEAKGKSDFVVAQFHWGVEYEPAPIQSQINVAHEAIASGADLIIGTHPHTVQGMEYYRNVPVLYSLGNFIFDQEWSIETKQGTLAETYFYNHKLMSVKLIPYQIEDYNQPGLATDSQKKQILDRIFNVSLSPDYKY